MLPKEIFGFSPQSPLLWVCDSLVVSNARKLKKKFVQSSQSTGKDFIIIIIIIITIIIIIIIPLLLLKLILILILIIQLSLLLFLLLTICLL